MIDDVLKSYIGEIWQIYIDDTIILDGSENDHLRNLHTIFKRLQNANLKVNLRKSKFFRTEVEFLGYIASKSGITTDLQKNRGRKQNKVTRKFERSQIIPWVSIVLS